MKEYAGRRGFTVIELGALIAVGGSMTAVMAPIGNQVQKKNLDTQSQWVHHDLARRQFVYMGDHDGAFTGPNTSGAKWNKDLLPGFANKGIETLEFDTAGGNPTSFGDWITPLVGDAYGFSANRAMRMNQKFDVVGDPTANRMVDLLFTADEPSDFGQFETVFKELGYRQQSFLQMRSFAYYSVEHSQFSFVIDQANDIGYLERFAVQSETDLALTPEGYTPNIANVGTQLSNKVMFADGTRFYTDDDGLDMSIDTLSVQFTEDSDSGPIRNNSPAYGRDFAFSPSQTNLDLSFRKNGGQGMYATMFDGSLKFLTREEAWTDPTPWYPSGSVWQDSTSATPESQAWVNKNLPGGVIH